MSPQTHDWEVIRKHIKDAENTLIQEILDDLEITKKHPNIFTLDMQIEKWEERLKE